MAATEGGRTVGAVGALGREAVIDAKERPHLPPMTFQPGPSPGGGVLRSRAEPTGCMWGGEDLVNPEILD